MLGKFNEKKNASKQQKKTKLVIFSKTLQKQQLFFTKNYENTFILNENGQSNLLYVFVTA